MKDVALRAGILGVRMQNFFVGSLDTAVGLVWSLAGEVVFYLVLPPARPPGADSGLSYVLAHRDSEIGAGDVRHVGEPIRLRESHDPPGIGRLLVS